jgi:histidyl-tRNA synthetase
MLGHARALGVPEARLRVDLSLTRGLDYYTGPVYEIVTTEIERFGSLGGGGRYDDLMSLFGGEPVPATGVSIGLTRLLTALVKLGKLKARESATDVLISRFPDTPVDAALACAATLRDQGFAVEWYYEADRLKKQFQYAERKGIPFVVILGASEIERGEAAVKHLATGEQVTMTRDAVAGWMRARLTPKA